MRFRRGYWDPRFDTSTKTSVVRPVGNPQQVSVTEVNRPEFYNQANDMQPSRVTPLPGVLNTQPAILRPDPMWAHRWPDIGPYRGMTAQPFAWEQKQIDGLGEITAAQRTRYQELIARVSTLTSDIRALREAATTADRIGRLSLIEGQLDRANGVLTGVADSQDIELDMAMDDVEMELDQVNERIAALNGGRPAQAGMAFTPGVMLAGVAVVGALFYFGTRKRSSW